jgi:CBS domain-containing protein
MKIESLMTTDVRVCFASGSLADAARVMWEGDCGCVPVLDEDTRVVGILTDRDICMAAWTQGRPLAEIPVPSAMSAKVVACKCGDRIEDVEELMRQHQVRRVPVLDADGRLEGLVSLADLAGEAQREMFRLQRDVEGLGVATTLAAVSRSRRPRPQTELKVELIPEKSEPVVKAKSESQAAPARLERTKVTLG